MMGQCYRICKPLFKNRLWKNLVLNNMAMLKGYDMAQVKLLKRKELTSVEFGQLKYQAVTLRS